MGMRTRITALAAVVAFALMVATVAVLAARSGDDHQLVKLPIGSMGSAEGSAGGTSARSGMWAPYGPVEYRLAGALRELPSTGPAYQLGSSATAAEVRRLAEILGVDGELEEEQGAWVVRSGARELRAQHVPGVPWYLGTVCAETPVSSDAPDKAAGISCAEARGSVGPVVSSEAVAVLRGRASVSAPPECKDTNHACAVAEPMPLAGPPPPTPAPAPSAPAPSAVRPAGSAPSPPSAGWPDRAVAAVPVPPPTAVACDAAGECVAPHPGPVPEPPPRPADLPTRGEAEDAARSLFTRLGVGTDGFAMDDGWATWEAHVEPRVDGWRVFGLWHGLSIGPKGEVVGGSGFLGRPELIGDYPLAGLDKGLERLRGEAGFGPRPLAVDLPAGTEPAVGLEAPASTAAGGTEPTGPAGATEPGSPPLNCSDPGGPCPPPPDSKPPEPAEPRLPPPDWTPPEPAEPPPPLVRTITDAFLALQQVDDKLVPVYVFEFEDGSQSFPVPAVTDEWLQQQVPPSTEAKRD